MTSALDPLDQPLQLLREARLASGFEDRLAECLREVHRQGTAPVLRLPGRKRVLLLVAAIALPAAAAVAGGYYVLRGVTASQPASNTREVEGKPLGHLPRVNFLVDRPIATPSTPAPPVIDELPQRRVQGRARMHDSTPKNGVQASSPAKVEHKSRSGEAPRIEALDPFASKTHAGKQPSAIPMDVNASETLRNATKQGVPAAVQERAHRTRGDLHSRENRGSDAAQQARERVQARERKGQ